LYERYKFNSLTIWFQQASNTSSAGSYLGYYDPDPVDDSPAGVLGIENASQHAGASSGSFWTNHSWKMPFKKAADPYWVEIDGTSPQALRDSVQQRFRILLETPNGVSTAVTYGQVHISFDITFVEPRAVLQVPRYDSWYTVGTTVDLYTVASGQIGSTFFNSGNITHVGDSTSLQSPDVVSGSVNSKWTVSPGTWQVTVAMRLETGTAGAAMDPTSFVPEFFCNVGTNIYQCEAFTSRVLPSIPFSATCVYVVPSGVSGTLKMNFTIGTQASKLLKFDTFQVNFITIPSGAHVAYSLLHQPKVEIDWVEKYAEMRREIDGLLKHQLSFDGDFMHTPPPSPKKESKEEKAIVPVAPFAPIEIQSGATVYSGSSATSRDSSMHTAFHSHGRKRPYSSSLPTTQSVGSMSSSSLGSTH
jgi:hypothetical protein